ncbi:nitrogenase molybdenum-iron protein alpha chain [Orenia metallireducens]|uniref:Nitrogenase protein alpha chain n=1 Tax=Orenia metallireducens TaxID=1413210 RepID=A0A1C0AAE1_9FIRM|nr:nitrogenase molybdenum-iron protein alpha chain [Orenia metallireducens]OCL27246.1 nitrogenase molybdenum-iron protein alpha chain [Orenia metallireducens]
MIDNKKLLDNLLSAYPGKSMKNRKEHMMVKDSNKNEQHIMANTRTIPGIMTNRGCAYAGCKGVVLGPLKDVVHITHGPIGCSYYTWGTRRHKGRAKDGEKNFISYAFSTDMQDPDIVFGGEKKLKQAIKEAVEIFEPEAISISATCPVGLIGDDINAVAKEAQEKYGIPVLAFSCEGYKGVSQSAGHHIANNNLMEHVIGTKEREPKKKYPINLLGEYNIGGDGFEISRILDKIGYDIVSIMTGDGTLEEIKTAHTADLNLVQCHRSINYIAEMLEEKFGIPWLKVNFIGVQGTIETLRNMAKYFDDEALIQRTEEVIEEELGEIKDLLAKYKEMCDGNTACLFVGGSRAHHYQNLFKEIGIETVVAGYEFGHRDDYEGRGIIPDIEMTADDRNIPELTVTKDEKRYKLRLSKERYKKLQEEMPLGDYKGMISEMKDGQVIIDDLNHYETEIILNALKPAVFGSGIKDKYVAQKMGIFSKQLHSYDYSGPYAGFKGAVNFARDISAGINTPTWNYITAPWKNDPQIEAELGGAS